MKNDRSRFTRLSSAAPTTRDFQEGRPNPGEIKKYEWVDYGEGDWRRLLGLPEQFLNTPIKAVLTLVESKSGFRFLLTLGRNTQMEESFQNLAKNFIHKRQLFATKEKAIREMFDLKDRLQFKGVSCLGFPGGWRPVDVKSD
jgi:hypothetical protein